MRYGGLRGQEQAAAALAALSFKSADVIVSLLADGVLATLVSLLRRGSADVKGSTAILLMNLARYSAETVIPLRKEIVAVGAIEPLVALLDDGTPTRLSLDGELSTIGKEASGALRGLGWHAPAWALDRLDADDADEAARAVLSEIGEEEQHARTKRAQRDKEMQALELTTLIGKLPPWLPTRDGASCGRRSRCRRRSR